MTETLNRFPTRKNPRLQNYDYSQPNDYFITICSKDKRCIFGSPAQLNEVGQIALRALIDIPSHFPGIFVDKYVVMPNHIHVIVAVTEPGTALPHIIGQYKSSVTRQARKLFPDLDVWQASFHDHIIRNQSDYLRIWNYIEGNPARWEEDCFYCTASK